MGIVVAIVQFQDYLFTKQSDTFTVVGVNYTPIISALLLVIVIAVSFSFLIIFSNYIIDICHPFF